MSLRALTSLTMLLALSALPAAAAPKEELSIGGAKLGSSTADVRKVFPKMEPTTENLGAQPFDSEFLTRYVVKNVKIPETGKPGTLELRFWKDKLWAIIAYYGDGNGPKVVEALTKRLGPPNGTNPQKPGWQGEKSLMFIEEEHGWYSLTDNALSKEAQTWFFAQIEKMKQGIAASKAAAPPAGAPPAAAPPAAAPPAAAPPAAAPPAAAPAATPVAK